MRGALKRLEEQKPKREGGKATFTSQSKEEGEGMNTANSVNRHIEYFKQIILDTTSIFILPRLSREVMAERK